MNAPLLLIAGDDERRWRYAEVLSKLDVTFDEIDNLCDLKDQTRTTAYSGILIDIATQARCPARIREKVNHILDLYPVARLQWDTDRNRVKALIPVQHDEDDSFKFFTQRYCPTIQPRTTRGVERIRLNFNLQLSLTRDGLTDNPTPTITLNVSHHGCFICSSEDWEMGQHVWFILNELKDKTPICGRVCWLIPWGEKMRIPGIGVEFTEIQKPQLEELKRWFP
jgi:PilZ domain